MTTDDQDPPEPELTPAEQHALLVAIGERLQAAAAAVVTAERSRRRWDDAVYDPLEEAVRERVGALAVGSELAVAWARQIETYDGVRRYRAVWRRPALLGPSLGVSVFILALYATFSPVVLAVVMGLVILAISHPLLVRTARLVDGTSDAPVAALAARRDVEALLKGEIAHVARDLEPLDVGPPADDRVTLGRAVNLSTRLADGSQRHEVEAMRRVRSHVLRTGGAVVGIAGERGSGKSELIHGACSDDLFDGEGDRVVGVVVPAPTATDVEGFIRLVVSKVAEATPDFEPLIERRRRHRLRVLRLALFATAIAAIWGGIVLATDVDAPRPTPAWGWAATALGVLALLAALVWVQALGALVHLRRAVADRRSGRQASISLALALRRTRATAARHARHLHHEVRHVETLSTSREIGFGAQGATGKVGSARSIQALPLTTADLVHRLDQLAAALDRAGYVVVVGIDELDRLEAGDDTERFLNGVKQLFTITRCSFLVSLSDSARTQFMRRGVDVRTVLDSSFDDVVDVDPLDLRSARSVLRLRGELRVTDLQVMLCWVLAGGLPRELLRRCRDLADVNQDLAGTVPFTEAVAVMARNEWTETLDGVVAVVRSWPAHPDRSTLLGLLETARPDADELTRRPFVGHAEWEHAAEAAAALDLLHATWLFLRLVRTAFGRASAGPVEAQGEALAEARRAIGYDVVTGRQHVERLARRMIRSAAQSA